MGFKVRFQCSEWTKVKLSQFQHGDCKKGSQCKFRHEKLVNKENSQKYCNNGESCWYYAKGGCKFIHTPNPNNVRNCKLLMYILVGNDV